MKKITSVEELMEILENGQANYYGLRKATEHDIEIMDRGYLDCSIDMFDNEDAEYSEDVELLSGTSAISVNGYLSKETLLERYETLKSYLGKTVLLISDSRATEGTDYNEIVLGHNGYGADVEAIVEL